MKIGRRSQALNNEDDFEFISDCVPDGVASAESSTEFSSDAPQRTSIRKAAVVLLALAALLTTASAAWFAINKFAGTRPSPTYVAGWLPNGYKPLYRTDLISPSANLPRVRFVTLINASEGDDLFVRVLSPEENGSVRREPGKGAGQTFQAGGRLWTVSEQAAGEYFSAETVGPSGYAIEVDGKTIAVAKTLLDNLQIDDDLVPSFSKFGPGWEVMRPTPVTSVMYARTPEGENKRRDWIVVETAVNKNFLFRGDYRTGPVRRILAGRRANVDVDVSVDYGEHVVLIGGSENEDTLVRIAESLHSMDSSDKSSFPKREFVEVGNQLFGGKLTKKGLLPDGHKWRLVRTDDYFDQLDRPFVVGLSNVPGAAFDTISADPNLVLWHLKIGLDLSTISIPAEDRPSTVTVRRNGRPITAHFIPEAVEGRMYAFIPTELTTRDKLEIALRQTDPKNGKAGFETLVTRTYDATAFRFSYN